MLNRRDFIKFSLVVPYALQVQAQELFAKETPGLKEALFYDKAKTGTSVACRLCPRACVIADGDMGLCRARKNISGVLYSLGYGQPCSMHTDPIEKKPFFHVLPTTTSLSIASAGCNLRCMFCQNWQISQVSPLETRNLSMTPDQVVARAKQAGCRSIAYTYTEPTNFYEYMLDTAKKAKKEGVLNVSHSNGYINPVPLKDLAPYMDAVNIDLKGYSSAFYRKYCDGDLAPVLETIRGLRSGGVWVEITNLVIAGHNDDVNMIGEMCDWLRKNVGPDIPVHFSRFFPMYKMTSVAPTPVSALERAREAAVKAGLRYAYIGNVPGHPGENTYCFQCKRLLIRRAGYSILGNVMKNGKCPSCGTKIGGVWTG